MVTHIPAGSILGSSVPPSGSWSSTSAPTNFAQIKNTSIIVGYQDGSQPANTEPASAANGWNTPTAGSTDAPEGALVGDATSSTPVPAYWMILEAEASGD